jgi:hypothetical protein
MLSVRSGKVSLTFYISVSHLYECEIIHLSYSIVLRIMLIIVNIMFSSYPAVLFSMVSVTCGQFTQSEKLNG